MQCVGDSATKFQHSYRGVSDSPGGGYASFDVNTTAQVTGYRIGNYIYEPQSRFARLWLDSQHDNLPKGIRTIKMCKLCSNDARW